MIALMLALAFLAGNRQKSGDEMRHIDHAQAAQLVDDSRHARRTTVMQMQGRLYLPVRIRGFGQRFRVFGRVCKKKGENLERVTKLPVISILWKPVTRDKLPLRRCW